MGHKHNDEDVRVMQKKKEKRNKEMREREQR